MNSLSVRMDGGGYLTSIFYGHFDAKYVCNLCSKVLKDPVQSYCGHRFCRSCIQAVVSSGQRSQCQMCLKEGVTEDYSFLHGDQMFPDNGLRREMAHLRVKCPLQGCTWDGTFKEMERHVGNCDFRGVTCAQCGQTFSLALASQHKQSCPKRNVTCKHCGLETTYDELEPHSKVCLKHPLKCGPCGKKKIPREMMQHHLNTECQGTRKQCPVDEEWVEQEKFMQHISSDPNHLTWIMQEIDKCKRMLGNQPAPPNDAHMNTLISKVQEGETKLVNLEQHILEIAAKLSNSEAHVSADGVSTTIRGTLSTVDQRCHTLEVKISTFENVAETLHREVERNISAVEGCGQESRATKEMLDALQRKVLDLERSIALKDTALSEQSLRIEALEMSSYTGDLLWRIPQFSKKQEEASKGRTISVYSPAFYTSKTGYKMCARLYPKGDGAGKGTHVSLFFVIMKGHYDSLMIWPFQQRVTLMLLDQKGGQHIVDSFMPDPTSSSFKRPTSNMNIASGCPMFLPLERLQDKHTAFVKDDTMFIRIIVDTTTNSQPAIAFPKK